MLRRRQEREAVADASTAEGKGPSRWRHGFKSRLGLQANTWVRRLGETKVCSLNIELAWLFAQH
jgi:hypothetical protein